ncbi:hypothetical protein EXT49_21680, partial [Pectobacterium polaris]|nr:hypothetical protein [Pectobacterium polaris]
MSGPTSYPKGVITLLMNMIPRMAVNPKFTGEQESFMLWNAILNTHFPADMGYGITFHKTVDSKDGDDFTNYLVVKLIREGEESTVLVVTVRKNADDSSPGREAVEKKAMEYVDSPGFDETEFPDIYSITSVGLSWAGTKMEEPKTEKYLDGSEKPESLVDWTTNMASAVSFEKLKSIAGKVHSMT